MADLGEQVPDVAGTADFLRDGQRDRGGLVLQGRVFRRLDGKPQHVDARITPHDFEDQVLLVLAAGRCERRAAHLDALRVGQGELANKADVTPQGADLVLGVRCGLRQVQQDRRRIDGHPLAQQAARRVL